MLVTVLDIHRSEPIPLTAQEKEKFDACQKVIWQMMDKISEKNSLDMQIALFCKENQISLNSFRDWAKTSPKNDASEELSPFQVAIQQMKQSLELGIEIDAYNKAIQSIKTLEYIKKYKDMIQSLRAAIPTLSDRQAREAIAICAYGLTHPYPLKANQNTYQNLVTKEENAFHKIKDEIYYRIAEKGIAALKCESSMPLMKIALHLQYIVTIIELASYGSNFFNGEKIQYEFNGRVQEKYIPPLLYSYYMKLKKLLKNTDSEDPSTFLKNLNNEIKHFQSALINEPIHGRWHIQFLTNLHTMANAPGAVAQSSPSSIKGEPSSSRHSSSSGSSSSFQAEDQRRRSISAEPSAEIHRTDLPQNSEIRPATPGRASP